MCGDDTSESCTNHHCNFQELWDTGHGAEDQSLQRYGAVFQEKSYLVIDLVDIHHEAICFAEISAPPPTLRWLVSRLNLRFLTDRGGRCWPYLLPPTLAIHQAWHSFLQLGQSQDSSQRWLEG